MKPFIRLPATAANEVSTDQFVRACVAFQQAKTVLSQHLNGADAMACDNVSRAVYNLANRALARKTPTKRTDPSGKRLTLPEAVAQSIHGKKSFDSQTVVEAMKRRGTLPKVENVKNYISTVLSTHKDRFKRLERGVYCLKEPVKKKLVFAPNKAPKELPSKTT
jgi:hypothetical protein